ncbi:MAG: hypothetical protein ACXACX_22080 [Candidatus Hodarchaeales archaeon]|jgi:hypothetical protein
MVETVQEPSVSEPSLWEKYRTIKATSRVEKLRQRYLDLPNKVVIDIARLRTQSRKETEGELFITRRAKSFAAIVRDMPFRRMVIF